MGKGLAAGEEGRELSPPLPSPRAVLRKGEMGTDLMNPPPFDEGFDLHLSVGGGSPGEGKVPEFPSPGTHAALFPGMLLLLCLFHSMDFKA